MQSIVPNIRILIFWISIVFIGIAVFTLTYAQNMEYEFASDVVQNNFYALIEIGLPISVLCTLFGTIQDSASKDTKLLIVISTIIISFLCIVVQLSLLFEINFGDWNTISILYKHKTEKREILYQQYDIGALGHGADRIVELKPILQFWVLPTPIDTNTIDTKEWKFVDIKFP